MILVDSSAWIEFLRDTGSRACIAVDRSLDSAIATCDPVAMEVLAGARDDQHLALLRGLLARSTVLPVTPSHYEEAASLYRVCRRRGETVRKLVDCLIAAVAIEHDAEVLHADRDFAVLARHTRVRIHTDSPTFG